MIRPKQLTFSYQSQPVFDDLSFTLEDFTSLAILGLNGEGKTTLIKCLLGLKQAQKGTVLLREEDIFSMTPARRARCFSYVPQENDDSLSMSVSDFICMGQILSQSIFTGPKESERKQAEEILSSLSCKNLISKNMNELSSGQKRLVYLARAIYQNSEIMVMDEPVSSLDFIKQHEFLSFITDYVKKEQKRIIMSIHDPVLAHEYCDTFLFLKDHKLLTLLSKKEENFREEFLSAVTEIYDHKVMAGITGGKLELTYRNKQE